jgi:hypothetical protein
LIFDMEPPGGIRYSGCHAFRKRDPAAGRTTYHVVVTGNAPPDDGGTDWRRLADERNVPLGLARALWERAWEAASGDPVQAEHAFLLLLDDAEAANITQEPGRGTLADSSASARDAFSLGPGKWTRVLLEQPRQARPAPRAGGGKRPSADELRDEIVAAEQAARDAAAMLAASDPATIIQALHEVSRGGGSAVLQKVVSMAGGVVGRLLGQRSKASPTQTSPAAEGATAEGAPAEGAPAEGATAGDPGAPSSLDPAPRR